MTDDEPTLLATELAARRMAFVRHIPYEEALEAVQRGALGEIRDEEEGL